MPKTPILLSKSSPKKLTKKGDLMLTTLILLLDFQAINVFISKFPFPTQYRISFRDFHYCSLNFDLKTFPFESYLKIAMNHDVTPHITFISTPKFPFCLAL